MRKIEKARNMMIEQSGEWIDIFDVAKNHCPSDFGMKDKYEDLEDCVTGTNCFDCWGDEVEDG